MSLSKRLRSLRSFEVAEVVDLLHELSNLDVVHDDYHDMDAQADEEYAPQHDDDDDQSCIICDQIKMCQTVVGLKKC